MKATTTRILLIGNNETLVNNVKKIIPPVYATAHCIPMLEEVSDLLRDYQPDIAILCLDIDVEMDVEAYAEMSSLGMFENLSVIVLGQVEECQTFEKKVFVRGIKMMQRPLKGGTLKLVLKKCEDEKEQHEKSGGYQGAGKSSVRLPDLRGGSRRDDDYRDEGRERRDSGRGRWDDERAEDRPYRDDDYIDYDEQRYRDERYGERESSPTSRERADRYEELPKEIIKIPTSRANSSKLHNDDILRIPPEKGRYFRNTVREKQVKRVRTVIEEEAEYVARRPTHISGKFSILVVDDDVQLLGAVRKYLQDDYYVTTVPSGKLAYKFVEVNVVDVILLDYLMRDEDGPSVFKRLRSNPATADTPIIFLTGVSDKDKVMNVLTLNPQGYLLKPIKKQELLDAIAKVLE